MGQLSDWMSDYFDDNFEKVTESFLNSDALPLSEIGEFVINHPVLLIEFIDAWGGLPANQERVREWYMKQSPEPDGKERDR